MAFCIAILWRTSFVFIALLLLMVDLAFACDDVHGGDCDDSEPLSPRSIRSVSCGSVICLNGGTCTIDSGSGDSTEGLGSAMGEPLQVGLEPCTCAPGYTGSDCSETVCSIKECGSDDSSSGLDMNVIIIIVVLMIFIVILAIVLVIILLACYLQRRKKRMLDFKLNYEVARSDSAELFDRIHTTFAMSTEAVNETPDLNQERRDETTEEEVDQSKDVTNETIFTNADEAEKDTNETTVAADKVGREETKETIVAMDDADKNETKETIVAVEDADKEETKTAVTVEDVKDDETKKIMVVGEDTCKKETEETTVTVEDVEAKETTVAAKDASKE